MTLEIPSLTSNDKKSELIGKIKKIDPNNENIYLSETLKVLETLNNSNSDVLVSIKDSINKGEWFKLNSLLVKLERLDGLHQIESEIIVNQTKKKKENSSISYYGGVSSTLYGQKENDTSSSNISSTIEYINGNTSGFLKDNAIYILSKYNDSDLSGEAKKILKEIKNPINKGNLASLLKEFDNEMKEGNVSPSGTSNKETTQYFIDRIEELKKLNIVGKIEKENKQEILEELLDKIDFDTEEEKNKFIKLFNNKFDNFISFKGNIDIKQTNKVLNTALDELKNKADTGPIKLSFGGELLPFNNKKEAIDFIEETKQGFIDIENMSFMGFLNGLGGMGDSTLDGIISFTSFSIDHWILSLLMIGGGYYTWSKIKTFYEQLNAPIKEHQIEKLTGVIEKYRQQLLDRGYEENSSEVKRLKKLSEQIGTSMTESSATDLNDHTRATKRIYRHLQSFRGMPGVDGTRFIFAMAGESADNLFFSEKDLDKKNYKIPEASTSKKWTRRLLFPLNFLNIALNKGPNGKLGGWNLQSKLNVILEYTKAFEKNSNKLDRISTILDDIKKSNPELYTKKIEKEIIEAQKGKIPFSKMDPLMKYYLEGLTKVEIDNIFSKLENDLKSQGLNINIKTSKDFILNIRKLEDGKWLSFKEIFKASNPIKNINRTIAEIINKNIPGGLGIEKVEEIMNKLTIGDRDFEKNGIEIEKINKFYSNFIEYFPELNGEQEKKLIEFSKKNAGTSIDANSYEKSILREMKTNYGIILEKAEIKEFVDGIKNGKLTINLEDNSTRNKISSLVSKIVRESSLSQLEKDNILNNITDITTGKGGNLTFWEPHLSLIIEKVLKGEYYDPKKDTIKYNDVKEFRNGYNLFTFLDNKRDNGINTQSARTTSSNTSNTEQNPNNSPENGRTQEPILEETENRAGQTNPNSEQTRQTPNNSPETKKTKLNNLFQQIELDYEIKKALGIDTGNFNIKSYKTNLLGTYTMLTDSKFEESFKNIKLDYIDQAKRIIDINSEISKLDDNRLKVRLENLIQKGKYKKVGKIIEQNTDLNNLYKIFPKTTETTANKGPKFDTLSVDQQEKIINEEFKKSHPREYYINLVEKKLYKEYLSPSNIPKDILLKLQKHKGRIFNGDFDIGDNLKSDAIKNYYFNIFKLDLSGNLLTKGTPQFGDMIKKVKTLNDFTLKSQVMNAMKNFRINGK